MLKLTIGTDVYNEETGEFSLNAEYVVELEHSLASLSKWESIHKKPLLGKDEKTSAETLSYIELMALNNPPADFIKRLNEAHVQAVNDYIDEKQTATWFNERGPRTKRSTQTVTSELIYYWMLSFKIPFECQHWHLSRLLTLIQVCNAQNAPEKKSSKAEIAARNRELNAARKAQMGTKG